ncbi:PLP-dependent transferase [Labilibaculum sp. K2S]|uniref:hypothetical protein n=1 Tax=Labilibaculum sp. K2S TaxID=3056386 RepID=UPI003FA59B9D|nr:PLP-dependent transferase [Labilibaculum sp. K2S]
MSLGSCKTLFNSQGNSTLSDIPKDERIKTGLTDSLVRISIELDDDVDRTYRKIKKCLKEIRPQA